ncbi:MAG: hypothetical protein Q9191_008287 [Dirinaria sp. TL-2023a]
MAPTRVCVFCGSSTGRTQDHLNAARSLAQAMHAHSIQLVYGGGTTGIMGELAETLVALSGKESVHGIIPSSMLSLERPNKSDPQKLPKNWRRRTGLGSSNKGKKAQLLDEKYGRVTVVKDLQARKKMMTELIMEGGKGSGFVALSGGFGTLDEVVEAVCWRQIGIHKCGIVFFNVDGFWDGVVSWIDRAVNDGFVRERGRNIVRDTCDADDAIRWLRHEESHSRDIGRKCEKKKTAS